MKKKYKDQLEALFKNKNSDLQKMSRPRITFPKIQGISTRPDQEVQLLETGRQKDLYGHKVANARLQNLKVTGPSRLSGSRKIVENKEDLLREAARQATSGFGRNTLGLQWDTPHGPKSSSLAGKLRSKFEEGDETDKAKVADYEKKVAEAKENYKNALNQWHEDINKFPAGSTAYYNHLGSRPVYKKPRKPAKSLKDTADLSEKQMKLRGKQVGSTIEHEGLHHVMSQIEQKFGGRARRDVVNHLLSFFPKETLEPLSDYIQTVNYKPKSPTFNEELLTHARDIITNPVKRERFKFFMAHGAWGKYINEDPEKHISALKQGHQKAYERSQTLTSEGVQALGGIKKLAASEKRSGPVQNLRGVTTSKLKQLAQDSYVNPDTGYEVEPDALHSEIARRAENKAPKMIADYKRKMKPQKPSGENPEDWFGKDEHLWQAVWQNMKDYHTGSVNEKDAPHMHERAKKYPTYELKDIPISKIKGASKPLLEEEDEKWAHKYAKLSTQAPPITLHPHPHESGEYNIIDGNHRARAAFLKGDTHIKAYVGKPNRPFGKKESLIGGKGDKKKISQFSPKEVKMGRKVEMEHTKSPKIAEEITRDHLTENPHYYSKLKQAGLADELEKGAKGDWQKEGYRFEHYSGESPIGIKHSVIAFLGEKPVGEYHFNDVGHGLQVSNAKTLRSHTRKGLASAAYRLAENKSNKKIIPGWGQTIAAQKLWAQPDRSFGKSELNKALPSAPKVNLNPEHGKIIANAYENMKHDPNNPHVKAAYNALAHETGKQYQNLLNQGYKFSPMKPGMENPYKTSKDMHADIANNKHLWYFPTEQGYGSEGDAPSDHPLLAPSKFKDKNGKVMLHNDVFRQVHDIMGHHLGGQSSFGAKGEHQAYLTHKKMYSPLAQKALASETLMQNSTVNYGKHGEHNRANPYDTIYADQKAIAAPDWIVNGRWHE